MSEPEWGDFKFILALGRGGSVAGAARILGVDSSTVSRRLAAVEEAIGSILIIRGGRDFCLTAQGKEAFAAAENMETIVGVALSHIRAAKTEIEGLVRISCVPGLMEFLIPLQTSVATRFPRLRVEVTSAFQIVDLAKGDADIALRMSPPSSPDLIGKKAFEFGMGLYASKKYVAEYGLLESLDDLQHHKIVHYSNAFSHIPTFSWIEKYLKPSESVLRADGPDMALNLVRSGGGIGIVDCYRADKSADVVRAFPEPFKQIPGWIVYHESLRNTGRIKAIVDMLVEFLAQNQAVLSGKASY